MVSHEGQWGVDILMSLLPRGQAYSTEIHSSANISPIQELLLASAINCLFLIRFPQISAVITLVHSLLLIRMIFLMLKLALT